jgi:hypothetical protein
MEKDYLQLLYKFDTEYVNGRLTKDWTRETKCPMKN